MTGLSQESSSNSTCKCENKQIPGSVHRSFGLNSSGCSSDSFASIFFMLCSRDFLFSFLNKKLEDEVKMHFHKPDLESY